MCGSPRASVSPAQFCKNACFHSVAIWNLAMRGIVSGIMDLFAACKSAKWLDLL